jgi:elongation factor 1 alpha-like protein
MFDHEGHVDAGKSTLMGHMLYLLGKVNERTMKKYERDSQKLGKSSFAFAWVLDETDEERNRFA